MQLTRAADYGVRAMILLASVPEGTRVSSGELAEATGTSEMFLAKVMQRLVNSRLVNSARGHGGGFALSLPAWRISLLNVIEAIDGPIALNFCTAQCVSTGLTCDRKDWCAAHVVWAQAQAKVREILGAAPLDMLARDSARRLAALERTG